MVSFSPKLETVSLPLMLFFNLLLFAFHRDFGRSLLLTSARNYQILFGFDRPSMNSVCSEDVEQFIPFIPRVSWQILTKKFGEGPSGFRKWGEGGVVCIIRLNSNGGSRTPKSLFPFRFSTFYTYSSSLTFFYW